MRRIAILAVLAVALVASVAVADPVQWNGLTVGQTYNLQISEPVTYWGYIQQIIPGTSTNIAVTGGAGYTLPSISVTAATTNPFWAICIDTHEWSANPEGAVLLQGWASSHTPLGSTGRYNGTVVDQASWNRITYMFSQNYAQLGSMNTAQKAAFQLAAWEVLSGDGSATGGDWLAGNFRATSVTGSVLTAANTYVAGAFDAGFAQWSTSLANQAFYFSGVWNGNQTAYQDFLVYAPTVPKPQSVVPEIPAVALGPLGLMALGILKRRFVK